MRLGNCRKLLQRRPNTVQILFRLSLQPSNRPEQVAFPLAFSFRFPHCLVFGATTVNSQLNYAISYVHSSMGKCVPMCVCMSVSCTIFTSPLVLVTFWVCCSTCFTFLLSSPPFDCMWTTLLAFPAYRWLLGCPLFSPSYPLLSSVSVLFSMPRALFGLLHVLSPSRVGGCKPSQVHWSWAQMPLGLRRSKTIACRPVECARLANVSY